jgi:hypothetical protein
MDLEAGSAEKYRSPLLNLDQDGWSRLPGSTSGFPGPIVCTSRGSGPCAPAMHLNPGCRIDGPPKGDRAPSVSNLDLLII